VMLSLFQLSHCILHELHSNHLKQLSKYQHLKIEKMNKRLMKEKIERLIEALSYTKEFNYEKVNKCNQC